MTESGTLTPLQNAFPQAEIKGYGKAQAKYKELKIFKSLKNKKQERNHGIKPMNPYKQKKQNQKEKLWQKLID